MKVILLSVAMILASIPAHAGEADSATDDTMSVKEFVRQESLELPGLTAGCHVCEWRPKLNQKPAAEQCGVDAAGNPLLGLFECGYSEDCERVCNFLGCGEES